MLYFQLLISLYVIPTGSGHLLNSMGETKARWRAASINTHLQRPERGLWRVQEINLVRTLLGVVGLRTDWMLLGPLKVEVLLDSTDQG